MCGQSTAYNTYATLPYTNPIFMGFSSYQNVLKEIIFAHATGSVMIKMESRYKVTCTALFFVLVSVTIRT